MPCCDVMIEICVKRKWTSVIRSEPAGHPALTFCASIRHPSNSLPVFPLFNNLSIPRRECQHRFTALISFLQQTTCAARFYPPLRASRSINDPLEDLQSWKTTKRHHLTTSFIKRINP